MKLIGRGGLVLRRYVCIICCLLVMCPLTHGAVPMALPEPDALAPLRDLLTAPPLPMKPVIVGRWVDYLYPAQRTRDFTVAELQVAAWDVTRPPSPPSLTADDGGQPIIPAPILRSSWREGRDEIDMVAFEFDAWAERTSLSTRRIFRSTNYVVGMHIMAFGLLLALPESVTNWTEEDRNMSASELVDKWKDNVRAGPVWDKDDFYLNYIVHPLMGSSYYGIARRHGASPWGAFWYSFFCSTFIWEYGIEAFAEVPSIQDLIVTPIFGALIGEHMLRTTDRIRDHGSRIWGSRFLGNFFLFIVDPVYTVARALERDVTRLFGVSPRTDLVHEINHLPPYLNEDSSAVIRNQGVRERFTGLRLKFPL